MDVVSDVLRSIRLEGTIFFRSVMQAPWGINKPVSENPVFHIALDGACFVKSTHMVRPIMMTDGELVLLPYGDAHWIADSPDSSRIPRELSCEAWVPGEDVSSEAVSCVRLLCGVLRFDNGARHPLMQALPPYVHIKQENSKHQWWLKQTVTLIDQEMDVGEPGAQVMSDRLCEMLFIQILRTHSELTKDSRSFLAAVKDRAINKVLQLIHGQVHAPWTLESLAHEVGMSRSVLARRFSELVGTPLIAYLTAWRMQKAYNLLSDQNNSLVSIASQVGYSSVEAFSKAFKRYFGSNPSEVRKKENK